MRATAAAHFRTERFLRHAANTARDTAAAPCIAARAALGWSLGNSANGTIPGNWCGADSSGPPALKLDGGHARRQRAFRIELWCYGERRSTQRSTTAKDGDS